MLAEFRRRVLCIEWCFTESDWVANDSDFADLRMIHFCYVTVDQGLFVIENVFVLLHWRGENVDLGEQFHPFFSRLSRKDFVKELLNLHAVEVTNDIIAILRVREYVLNTHNTTEIRPTFIINTSQANPTILGFE